MLLPCPQEAIKFWESIVKISSAFSEKLTTGLEGGLNNEMHVKNAISDFTSFMEATVESNSNIYSDFSRNIQV